MRVKLRWKLILKDTVKFYQVLSVIGADFQTMTTFFPGKSRDSLKVCYILIILNNYKNKFKCEEKIHIDLIDRALSFLKFNIIKAYRQISFIRNWWIIYENIWKWTTIKKLFYVQI